MIFDDTSVPENLRIQLSGFLSPGTAHSRNMRFEEIYELLPKDREHVVNVKEPW